MDIIEFKSKKEFYHIEESDVKNNTARFTDDWDKKRWDKYKYATHIQISQAEGFMSFIREIRHKCTYKNIAIITWIPKNH